MGRERPVGSRGRFGVRILRGRGTVSRGSECPILGFGWCRVSITPRRACGEEAERG